MPLSRLAELRSNITRKLGSATLDSHLLRGLLAKRRPRAVEGCAIEPRLAAMLALDDLMKASDLRRFAPTKARAHLVESVAGVCEQITEGVDVDDLRLQGPAGLLPARKYIPTGLASPSAAIFFIHGGGWVTGDLDTHDSFCRRVALDARARVIAIDYRLAPESPFPGPVEDVTAAFRDVVARAPELGIDPARIAVMGDSAGGNLSAVISLHTKQDAIRPCLQVLIYPALDATCSHRSHLVFAEGWMLTRPMIDWYYGHYAGDEDPTKRRHPDMSPLFAPSLEGLPPALIYTAGFDPLRDEAAAYAERLKKAGVSVELVCFDSMIHGFILMGGVVPAAKEASSRIARDTGARLGSAV